jgi:hypothetical protein
VKNAAAAAAVVVGADSEAAVAAAEADSAAVVVAAAVASAAVVAAVAETVATAAVETATNRLARHFRAKISGSPVYPGGGSLLPIANCRLKEWGRSFPPYSNRQLAIGDRQSDLHFNRVLRAIVLAKIAVDAVLRLH